MKELGEFLKMERERQGLELPIITQQTCISLSMLTALEEGDADKIGTPLLVRSFTRAYCRVLRIDPAPVLERYTGETPRHERLDEGIRRFRERSLATRERTRLRMVMAVMTVITIGAVYFTAVWLPKRDAGGFRSNQEMTGSDPVPADIVPPVVAVPPGEPGNKAGSADRGGESSAVNQPGGGEAEPSGQVIRRPVIAAAGGQTEPAASKPAATATVPQRGHRLRIEATQESWVEVRLDDKKVEGAWLTPGQSREWTVDKNLRVLVGNAGGVRLTWDGKKLKNLGKAGQAARLRLPDDAAKF